MGFLDIFKVNSIKAERDAFKIRISELETYLTPELRDLDNVRRSVDKEKKKLEDLNAEFSKRKDELQIIESSIAACESDILV